MSKPSRSSFILAFAAIYLIWGSTYLAIHFGVETIPPFLLAGVRFIVGGALFYLAALKGGGAKATAGQWLRAGMIGIFMIVGGNGLVTWSLVLVPSGLVALIVAIVPLWIVAFAWMWPGGSRPRNRVIFGLLLGFIGIGLLINPTDIGSPSEINTLGALIVVLATLLWSFGSIYSRYANQPESKIMSVCVQMIVGGVGLLISLTSGELSGFDLAAVSMKSFVSFLYVTIFGSLGYFAYVWLLKWSTPAKAATYAYVNPVIALFLGNILADEILSPRTLLLSGVILIAVIIIVGSKKISNGKQVIATDTQETSPAEVCTE